MKDKHGNEIEVGDVVKWVSMCGTISDTAVVKEVVEFIFWGDWKDHADYLSCSNSSNIEIMTKAASIPAEPQNSDFTQEDEAMLQHLIKRKAKHEAETESKKKIKVDFADAISDISYCNYDENFNYLKKKEIAERYINVLKAYHGIN